MNGERETAIKKNYAVLKGLPNGIYTINFKYLLTRIKAAANQKQTNKLSLAKLLKSKVLLKVNWARANIY